MPEPPFSRIPCGVGQAMSEDACDAGGTMIATQSFSLRTPLIEFRSALALGGVKTREDFDELVHTSPDCEVRMSLRRAGGGQCVRCVVYLSEERLLTGGFELFNEVGLEGHPIVAFGAGRGQVSYEFQWLHLDGAAWAISGERLRILVERLTLAVGPVPAPVSRRARSRRTTLRDLFPAAYPASAA